jgi:hypothetical protein
MSNSLLVESQWAAPASAPEKRTIQGIADRPDTASGLARSSMRTVLSSFSSPMGHPERIDFCPLREQAKKWRKDPVASWRPEHFLVFYSEP